MKRDKIVIIPTYNEADTIAGLIDDIFRHAPETDVLVVDDNSPDRTGAIVDELSRLDERVRCLHRIEKDGIGPAYLDGFKIAVKDGYEYILQMDADFSHNPKYIPSLFGLVKEHDLVIGSRYIKGGGVENWGMVRRLISRFGSIYAKMILGISVNDLTGGFKCFKRRALEDIGLDSVISKGYAFQIEMTYRVYKKGFKTKEFPIIFSDRRVGRTKMSRMIFFEAIVNVWKMRSGKIG